MESHEAIPLQATRSAPHLALPEPAHVEEPIDEAPTYEPPHRHERRVQWVNIRDDEDEEEHPAPRARKRQSGVSHDGHVSVAMHSPDDRERHKDYFGDVNTSGSNTPDPYSALTTPEVSRPGTPTYEDVDIMEGETEGLPINNQRQANQRFKRQAAKLVAVHKAKERFMQGSKKRSSNEGPDPEAVAAALRTVSPRPSHEAHRDQHPPAQPGARGVLSSLLKLYDGPNAPSMNSSQATLVHNTEDSSRKASTPPSSRGSFDQLSSVLKTAKSTTDNVTRTVEDATHRVARNVDKAVDSVTGQFERPVAARSGGGVFAALQASAMDLAGAAAPSASTIRPATDKSGFRVHRHHLEARPATASSSEPSTPSFGLHTGAQTPALQTPGLKERRGFKGSHTSLSDLGSLFDHRKLYNESAVLRKQNSAPGTPMHEYSWDEKSGKKSSGGKSRKPKKKQEEIFITMHVAAILQRQDFLLRLSRALMMFGAPSHRIEAQIQSTAAVLDIKCQVIFMMNFMIIAFQDEDTHTSDIKFIKQGSALDLAKLTEISTLHYEVMHDKIGVEDASFEISRLMKAKPLYKAWQIIIIGFWCSAFIGISAFNASLIDMLVSAPLGAGLVAVQLYVSRKSDILSSIFEIVVAAVASFVAAGLASTYLFCYASITSAAIVLILPGWLVCNAALELQARSIVCGSVRLVWAVFFSLLLGFGISIGAQFWVLFSGESVVSPNDGSCIGSHYTTEDGNFIWWRRTIPLWFAFLSVPGFSAMLALRNGADWRKKEFPATVAIASAGWTVNHFASVGFPGRSDISSLLGSFTVGLLGSLWGKAFQGTSFIVAVVGVLLQLPSGLGNGGLLNFAATTDNSQASFESGFAVAQQLITVAIGLVVGLFCSTAVMYPFGKRRGGLMTF